MATSTSTVARAAPRKIKASPASEIKHRLFTLATVLDGVAVALALAQADKGPDAEDDAALLHMLETTVQVWADEARQISDDLPGEGKTAVA